MRGLGYLADDGDWNGSLLLDHMRAVSWWLQADGPLRLAPEDIWRGGASLRDDRNGELRQQIRRMTLPPEALLLRRMEGLLFQVASTLRAEASWGALMGELIEGGEPVGQLGRGACRLARLKGAECHDPGDCVRHPSLSISRRAPRRRRHPPGRYCPARPGELESVMRKIGWSAGSGRARKTPATVGSLP